MAKHKSNRISRHVVRWTNVWLLAVVFCCAGMVILPLFYGFVYPSLRADFVAARAKPRVETIYNRIQENIPDGARLVAEEKPESDTYTWALSDEAHRYAVVRGQQHYETMIVAFNAVLAFYEAAFAEWGWVAFPVDDESDFISIIFRSPHDDNLWAGVCTPAEPVVPQNPIQYVVFFEFNETDGCEGYRLWCIAGRYCK